METSIVVEPVQRLKVDISMVRFVNALQDNISVNPYGIIAKAANLVAQHGLQIRGILADDFPAIDERVL